MFTSALACIFLGLCGCPSDAPRVYVQSPAGSQHGALIRVFGDNFEDIKQSILPGEQRSFLICKTGDKKESNKIEVAIENKNQENDGFFVYEKFKEMKIVLRPNGTLDRAYIR